MQIMASLVFHYQRLLRLDDPSIVTKEHAAAALGMKSAAAHASRSKRRSGSAATACAKRVRLLAQAELDLRGASGLDERTVIDVLVARRGSAGVRHHARRPAAERAGWLRRSFRGGSASSEPRACGGRRVLVDDARRRGLAEPLLRGLDDASASRRRYR